MPPVLYPHAQDGVEYTVVLKHILSDRWLWAVSLAGDRVAFESLRTWELLHTGWEGASFGEGCVDTSLFL